MEKRHGQAANLFTMPPKHQFSGVVKAAYGGDLDLLGRGDCLELLPGTIWNGKHHSFLRLADPDLNRAKAFVFERSLIEVDHRAQFFAHLTDGRAESAGPTIGYRVIQSQISGFKQRVHQLFFGDGVAYLNRPAVQTFRLRR